MITSRRSASRSLASLGRARRRNGSSYSARCLLIEPLEDRHLLNAIPVVTNPLPEVTVELGTTQSSIDISDVFRDPDSGDSLTYTVSAPVTVSDVVARVREGAAKTSQDESAQVDSVREILGTDLTPTDTTNRVYTGLLYAHTGQDRSLTIAAEHDPARGNISNYLQSVGLDTRLEQITYNGKAYYNVVGEKVGVTHPEVVYVIGAHYDSYEILGSTAYRGSPGANANASGVAAMLDLAYALAPYQFDCTIRFVAFDREEQGLFGSSGYVTGHSTESVQGMISLDMVGYRTAATVTTVNLYDANGQGTIKADLIDSFNTQFDGSFTAVDQGQRTASGHVAFENAGYDAVMVTQPSGYTQYRTYLDSLESRFIDYSYLTNITQGVARYLCDAAGLVNGTDQFRATVTGDLLTLTFFDDQIGSDTCTIRATDESGAWIQNSFKVVVSPDNDSPVLTPINPSMTTIDEDKIAEPGMTVASFVSGAISDSDAGASLGIAIVAADTGGGGTWEFWLTDTSTDWTAVPANLSAFRALLLRAEDQVRFRPDGVNTVTASLTYQAWDQTTITRNLEGNQWGVAPADLYGPSGISVSSFDDASLGLAAIHGIAIEGVNSDSGTWQCWIASSNSRISTTGAWVDLPSVSASNPLYLTSDDKLRFVRDGISSGAPSLTYQAWDRATSTAPRVLQGQDWVLSVPGGSSAFSLDADTAEQFVAAVNDAPTLNNSGSPTLTAINEDTPGTGTLVTTLIASVDPVTMITDLDIDSLQGIAVTGAVTAGGTWQYSVDGTLWMNIGAVSDASARLLAADARTRIRFVPAPNFNQTISGAATPTITFRAWDRSSGPNGGVANASATGGDKAFSTATETASIAVTAVNDPPALKNGALTELVLDNNDGLTSLGLDGIDYSAGGGADEAGLDTNGLTVGGGQSLTYVVSRLPDADLGTVYLENGTTEVAVGTTYSITELRGMKFLPAGTALGDTSLTFDVIDSGTPSQKLTQSVPIWIVSENTIGLFDTSNSWFYLRDSNTTGNADYQFAYGSGSWTTLVGDWNGDEYDGVGLYAPASSTFYLTNAYTTGYAEVTFGYGVPGGGWLPLVGDWNGDGDEGVGLYDPTSSTFYLTDTLSTGYAEYTFGYGQPNAGWTPLVGDWDGDGLAGVGLYDPHTSTFYLTNVLTTGVAQHTFAYGVPEAGWQPLVGDWNGNHSDGVGLYDPNGSTFYLANRLTGGMAEAIYSYGAANNGWKPLVGDWDANGTAGVGLYDRANSTFYLSDELVTDRVEHQAGFGELGKDYVPIVGTWTPKAQTSAVAASATDQVLTGTSLEDEAISVLSSTAASDATALDTVLTDLDLRA